MPHTLTRRRGAVAALLSAAALGLTGCSGDADPGSSAARSGSTGGNGPTTVQTAYGPIEVPADPERVVTLADSALDVALAVGVTPVGTTASRGGDAPPAYLGADAADVPVVGTVREANLEAVVEAAPDLILAASGLAQDQYDALSAIAPTVVPAASGVTEWEQPLETYAAALGAEDDLAERLDAVGERAAAVKEGGALDGDVAVVRWMANGAILMNAGLMPGSLLQDAGGQPVEAATKLGDQPHSDPLSLENLGQVDADHLFLATLGQDAGAALEAAKAQPAFTQLTAVQQGATASVSGDVWSSSSGPIAAEQVMDDIEAAAKARA